MASLTYQEHFHHELKKALQSEIETRKEQLTRAHMAPGFDFASYKYMVGVIEGLRSAIQISEEVDNIVKER